MKKITNFCLAIAILFAGASAHAGVVIEGTRVVYPGGKKEVSVRLTNQRAYPVLVEAWIDNGDASESAADAVPFVLTPPLFRMEPTKAQTLRIFQLPKAVNLPQDRESVFWLNVKDIPPEAKSDDGRLTIAYRSRLKLFYRPASLRASQVEAFENLKWSMDRSNDSIVVQNSSPYYITLAHIRAATDATDATESPGGMVAPFGRLKLQRPQGAGKGAAIEYAVINDYGAKVIFKGLIDSSAEGQP